MRYKLNVSFQGTASIEIEADSPDDARHLATTLTVTDLARAGHADVLAFKIAAREVTPVAALGGEHRDEGAPEHAPARPRPSGWYRPH